VSVVPSSTYLVANFKETQVGAMHPGQRAEITVDAYPGRTFDGKVESTSPGTGARFSMLPPDNASGNFVKVVQRVPVKIAWVDVPQDVKLSAGLSADVTVFTR
jgi:membrane fusion protein (multidrug efflux system)